MIVHERRYEVIAVIISWLAAENEGNVRLRTRVLKQFGAQLFGEEWIGVADIDEEIGKLCAIFDKRDSIVLAPCISRLAKVSAQRLDPPWHL